MNANAVKCDYCEDKGFVYVARDIFIGGRYYGAIEDMKDCPKCVRAEHCSSCGDYGFVRVNVPRSDARFGQMYPCMNCEKGKGMAAAALENALRNAELPDRYKKLSFKSWQHIPFGLRVGKELAYSAALLFAQAHRENFEVRLAAIYNDAKQPFVNEKGERLEDRPGNCLVFQGEPGVGKTGLVSAICNFLTANSPTLPLYTRCRDLITTVQNEYKPKVAEKVETPALERYKKCSLLIIDEMNLTNVTPDRQDILEEIVRHRHGNAFPTLFTMNIERAAFEEEWGQRTAKAVFEMSHWINVSGLPIRNEGQVVKERVQP